MYVQYDLKRAQAVPQMSVSLSLREQYVGRHTRSCFDRESGSDGEDAIKTSETAKRAPAVIGELSIFPGHQSPLQGCKLATCGLPDQMLNCCLHLPSHRSHDRMLAQTGRGIAEE